MHIIFCFHILLKIRMQLKDNVFTYLLKTLLPLCLIGTEPRYNKEMLNKHVNLSSFKKSLFYRGRVYGLRKTIWEKFLILWKYIYPCIQTPRGNF